MKKITRIIHLEDVRSDAEIVRREISKSGLPHQLKWVSTRADFEREVVAFNPDIVISDHSLPDYSSIDAFRKIKELDIDIPFILVTSTVSEEFAVMMMNEGIADYLLKDRLQRLPIAVTNALEKCESNRRSREYMEQIKNNEKRFRSLIENSRDIIVVTDETIRPLYISPSYEKITGWSPEQREAVDATTLVHPSDLVKYRGIVNKALHEPGVYFDIDYRLLTRSGQYIYVNGSVINVLNDPSIRGLVFNISDVTVRKMTEDSLRQSEANLTAIIENTDVSIYSIDRRFRYITFNSYQKQQLQAAFGLDIKVGDGVFEFLNKLNPAEALEWQEIYMRAFSGESLKFERKFRINGKDVYTSFSINPIRYGDVINGLACFAWDTTAERRITADLIDRNKHLEQYAYIVSHNLRGPVANILGIATLLGMKNSTDVDRSQGLEHIFSSARKLDEITRDLNEILQMSHRVNESHEDIELEELVASLKSSLDPMIESNGAMIITDFQKLPRIHSIKSYIHSVFYNLITNSIRFRRPDVVPVIRIESRLHEGRTWIQFTDNGRGLDVKASAGNLFGLYKRFHLDVEGKGMGLFMVRSQVESLGGSVSLRSVVNEGTEVTIVL